MDTNYSSFPSYDTVKAVILSNTPKQDGMNLGLAKVRIYDMRYQYKYFTQTGLMKPNTTSYLKEYFPKLKAEGVVLGEYIPSKRSPKIVTEDVEETVTNLGGEQQIQRDPATEMQIAFDHFKDVINTQFMRLVNQEVERQLREITFRSSTAKKVRLIR